MRLLWVFMTMAIGCYIMVSETAKAATRKFDGDFEFIEDDDSRALKKNVKKWLHDPENELCLPLNCKKSEICLLEDTFTAICISKEELNKARVVVVSKSRLVQHREMQMDSSNHIDDEDEFLDSEDDDLDQQEPKCKECPISNPVFLCGSDNKTYSSVCRLKYHNCIHNANIRINCTNFCPCKNLGRDIYSKRLQFYGQKNYVINSKYYPDITFKSRNFNYDNQHYQYLKYSNRGKDLKYKSKNLVGNAIVKKNNVRLKSMYKKLIENRKKCPSSSRPAMANRLLDWFSVVIADSKLQGQYFKTKGHFPIGCQNEVLWMFGHLDIDSDGKLSLSELYGLEHDQNEPCLKPFLDACDFNRDIFVSVAEWCQCFSKAERPCAAMRRRSSSDMVPNCDSKGYYQNIQCHQSLGLCWCVDQHGIEFAGTRVRGIKPNCDSIIHKINSSSLETNSVELEDDEDSSEVVEGSAQIPLDF